MKIWRYLAWFGWSALLIFWPLSVDRLIVSNSQPQEKVEEGLFRAPITQAPFGLLGGNFFESNEGKKRWNIRSEFAELHRKESYAFMQKVQADFFAEKTHNKIETKSQFGRSYFETQKINLEKDVTVQSKRGYLFEMDHLNYDGATHEFLTEDLVKMRGPSIRRPSMFLHGLGMVGDIDTEHFILQRQVGAQKQLKSGEWMKIDSKSGEFFTDDQRAIFIGNVRSVLPKVTLQSDIFELTSGDDKESFLARGNVRLKRKDSEGQAEMVSMEIGGNLITLEGNARVDSHNNHIRGQKIIMHTDEDRVEVESAEGNVKQ